MSPPLIFRPVCGADLSGAGSNVGRVLRDIANNIGNALATFWQMVTDLNLGDWADLATIGAAAVAIYAIIQARRLQRETNQPYVAVTMEPNAHVPEMMELVVKNFGSTVATDVQLRFDTTPRRSAWTTGDEEDLVIPKSIKTLVPGQEWRTVWDSGRHRNKSKLPTHHTVEVSYVGLGRKRIEHDYDLDWQAQYDRRYLDIRTEHHAAKDLREIKDLMKRNAKNGLRVQDPVSVSLVDSGQDVLDEQDEQRRQAAGERMIERLKAEGPWELPKAD